jgi:hypothetical protein
MRQPITDDMARTSRGILQSPPTVPRQKHSLANSLRLFSLPQAFFRPPSISSPVDYKDEVLHNGYSLITRPIHHHTNSFPQASRSLTTCSSLSP